MIPDVSNNILAPISVSWYVNTLLPITQCGNPNIPIFSPTGMLSNDSNGGKLPLNPKSVFNMHKSVIGFISSIIAVAGRHDKSVTSW